MYKILSKKLLYIIFKMEICEQLESKENQENNDSIRCGGVLHMKR
jgi:hypothetical protein